MPSPKTRARGWRAQPANPRTIRVQEERVAPSRLRRGVLNASPDEWRRCALGTNHITNFGVWQSGTRREALRLNRAGATLWRRPSVHTKPTR